jgi:acyl-coenzyme A synthetase/AMP-(fatty) acid ligase
LKNILLGYSDILESSVTFAKKGVDDFMEAFAFVVIENPSVTVTDIRARLTSERYPSHLIPKNIFITKTLPKTVTNKKIRVFSTLMNWQNTG